MDGGGDLGMERNVYIAIDKFVVLGEQSITHRGVRYRVPIIPSGSTRSVQMRVLGEFFLLTHPEYSLSHYLCFASHFPAR